MMIDNLMILADVTAAETATTTNATATVAQN